MSSRQRWFLITNLGGGVEQAAAIFKRRMMIEELFRDTKNVRNGWALRQVRIGKKGRFERLLLVLAVAYLLLMATGLAVASRFDPRE